VSDKKLFNEEEMCTENISKEGYVHMTKSLGILFVFLGRAFG
jgi:hypothetical protein